MKAKLGKQYRLSSGLILEVWGVDPGHPDEGRLGLCGVLGGHKCLFRFAESDLPIIFDAFREALGPQSKELDELDRDFAQLQKERAEAQAK